MVVVDEVLVLDDVEAVEDVDPAVVEVADAGSSSSPKPTSPLASTMASPATRARRGSSFETGRGQHRG